MNKIEILKSEDEHSIRNKIVQIRNTLESIEDPDFTFKYTPVKSFEDKQNYPLDFQIYMEEIGETEIAHNGFLVTYVLIPQNPNKNNDSDLWNWPFDSEDDDFWDEKNNLKIKDTKAITYDLDGSISYFDIRTKPYKFSNSYDEGTFTFFISWFAWTVDSFSEQTEKLEDILND